MTTSIDTNSSSLPLRRDIKTLGHILGEILVHHGGMQLLEKVEKLRVMAITLRKNDDKDIYNELK
jgi:phosphoenolpyruvate carboxylase